MSYQFIYIYIYWDSPNARNHPQVVRSTIPKRDGYLWQGFSYSNVGKAIGSTIPKFNINGCYKLLLILVKVNQLYYDILTFTMIDSYETIFNQKTYHC